jgi:hypothetical protein
MMEEIGLSPDQLRKVLAMGSKREQYVIPKEAQETLDDLSHKEHTFFVEVNREFLRGWKAMMLAAPRRLARYVTRNATGDFDGMFVGNPKAFKKLGQAAKDITSVVYGDAPLTGEVKEWVDRGGYGTTLQFQELGDLHELKAFRKAVDAAERGGPLNPLKGAKHH